MFGSVFDTKERNKQYNGDGFNPVFQATPVSTGTANTSSIPVAPPLPSNAEQTEILRSQQRQDRQRNEESKALDEASSHYHKGEYIAFNKISDAISSKVMGGENITVENVNATFTQSVGTDEIEADNKVQINKEKIKRVLHLIHKWDKLPSLKTCPKEVLRGDSFEGLIKIFENNRLIEEAAILRSFIMDRRPDDNAVPSSSETSSSSSSESIEASMETGEAGRLDEEQENSDRQIRTEMYNNLISRHQRVFFGRFVSTTTSPSVSYYSAKTVQWRFVDADKGNGKANKEGYIGEQEITYPMGLEVELLEIKEGTHIVDGVEKPLISITARMTGNDTISRRIQAEAERAIQD